MGASQSSKEEGIQYRERCYYLHGHHGPPVRECTWVPSRNLAFSGNHAWRQTSIPWASKEAQDKERHRVREMFLYNCFQNRLPTPSLSEKQENQLKAELAQIIEPNPTPVSVPSSRLKAFEKYIRTREQAERLMQRANEWVR
jgi:hypothetical protein